jgi:methionyl-tRNA formyltransferase
VHVVFMGTPEFAVSSLRALTAEHEVDAVFTRPDAVRGRGRALAPSAVKVEAEALGIPVYEPATMRDPAVHDQLRKLAPDVVVVAAYGLILPPEVLSVGSHGALNVHASLLPRWRGAAPIARAILAGDSETGVSIMRMEEGLDTGPYATVARLPIGDSDLAWLTAELADLGAEALLDTMRLVEAGTVEWIVQDDAAATYAGKMGPADVALDPALSVVDAWRRVRASSSSAPCALRVAGTRVRALAASMAPDASLESGRLSAGKHGVTLGLSDGALLITSLVPEGRNTMDASAWARGARLTDDATWGPV